MKKAIIVGGSNGIGLAIALQLNGYDRIVIIDREMPDDRLRNKVCVEYEQFDLNSNDFSLFDKHNDADMLMITAGIGRLALFEDTTEEMIATCMQINATATMRIIKRFYNRLTDKKPFMCGVMVSIAGFMSSPFFSVYGASKAALKIFIESVNVELTKKGTVNRILNVSPGSIKGTKFSGGENDISATADLASEIISRLEAHNDLFIPQYEEIFKGVLQRYHEDFRAEGMHSYEYKVKSGRVKG
ncbi:MAG: SDR family oxidoreductase [Prevotella sp.]|nr:SDR family oxidoreductase [Prevotella sp.]